MRAAVPGVRQSLATRVRPTVLPAVVAALLCGCTAPAPPADGPRGTSTAPAPSTASKPPPEPEATARPRPVRIAFAGDVHFEGALAARLDYPATALAPAARALASADLAVANLETSLGSGGRPEPGKRFTFSAPPAALGALAAAGVDVVSMANNHALDFGRDRLPSTFDAIRTASTEDPPLSVVGIGRDEAVAFAPALDDVGGTVVATLAASVADQDPTADRTGAWAAGPGRPGIADAIEPDRLLAGVRRADRRADVVVAYLHWGVQGERCPSDDQRRLAAELVEAGADVVVGTHAHELQGDGPLGDGYVAYGLGNFAWYSPGPTGVLTLTVRPPPERSGRATTTRAEWWPAQIGVDGVPAGVSGEAATDFERERESLVECAGLG